MRTTSPTVLDAYQTAFLQCVVKTHNRPANVFWVVGDSTRNSVLITNHLTTNQHQGDRLRRVFPLSPNDYSIELSVNRTTLQRTYSCVIDGATDLETTIFTYIVRNLDSVHNKVLNRTNHGEKKIKVYASSKHEPSLSLDKNKKGSDDAEDLSEEDLPTNDIKEQTPTES